MLSVRQTSELAESDGFSCSHKISAGELVSDWKLETFRFVCFVLD